MEAREYFERQKKLNKTYEKYLKDINEIERLVQSLSMNTREVDVSDTTIDGICNKLEGLKPRIREILKETDILAKEGRIAQDPLYYTRTNSRISKIEKDSKAA